MTELEFFNWLRSQQENKRLTQDMVDGAKELLATVPPHILKQCLEKIYQTNHVMGLSDAGFNLIGEFERFVSKPYIDLVGVPTIGYGNTYYLDGRKVTMKDKPLTEKEARELKRGIVNKDFAPAVNMALADAIAEGRVTQNMFDACVSLAYNIGTNGFAGSSVARLIRKGDKKAAADAFLAWNKGTIRGVKQVIPGLTNRRNKEKKLFLS